MLWWTVLLVCFGLGWVDAWLELWEGFVVEYGLRREVGCTYWMLLVGYVGIGTYGTCVTKVA